MIEKKLRNQNFFQGGSERLGGGASNEDKCLTECAEAPWGAQERSKVARV